MKNLLTILLLLFSMMSFSQDFIILKNGDEIKAKVLEIHDLKVDYKRFTNQGGPTYHINKSEIFMIKYASGDKDVFNTSPQTQTVVYPTAPVKDVNSVPTVFVYNPNIGKENCSAQKQRGAKIFGSRGTEVFYRQDVVFYGYDFTYLKLSNPRKMGESRMMIQQYFNEWNTVFNKNVGFNSLRKWLGKKAMVMGTPVFPNYQKRDFDNFITYDNYCFSYQDLQSIVKSYVLQETKGVGMVINLVNFNKENEYSMAYVTFFDIASREILYAVLVTGEAGGGGMVGHWASGVENAVRNIFIDEIFKRKIKNNGMIPTPLRLY